MICVSNEKSRSSGPGFFHLVFGEKLIVIFPVFYRGHLLLLCEYAYEVGLVVEAAVVAYFRGAAGCVYEQIASLGYTQVVYMCYERYSGLLLEEMTEGRFRHVYKYCYIGQADLLGDVLLNIFACLRDSP